jgi:hypothetical protein
MALPRQARDKQTNIGGKLQKEWRSVHAGSILLFDYRLLHRGQAHTGAKKRHLCVECFSYVCPEPVLAK